MARFILLTPEQADHVRGPSTSTLSAALAPVERQGDTFILGAGVLDDPVHGAHRAYLALLPQLEDDAPSFPAPLLAGEK